jgi:hypothetical protein
MSHSFQTIEGYELNVGPIEEGVVIADEAKVK